MERLAVHLPLMNSVVYPADQPLANIVDDPRYMQTTLTEWFTANTIFPAARELTYIEFPTKWVWNRKAKAWHSRKGSRKIGRAIYINPSCGELYYLRMLLNVAKGAHRMRTFVQLVVSCTQCLRMCVKLLDFLVTTMSGVNVSRKHLFGVQLLKCASCLLL